LVAVDEVLTSLPPRGTRDKSAQVGTACGGWGAHKPSPRGNPWQVRAGGDCLRWMRAMWAMFTLTPASPTLSQERVVVASPQRNPWQVRAGGDRLRWMRCSPAFPPGEGGPLAVDEGYVGNVYPRPGFADPLPGEGCSRLPPEEPVTSQRRWGLVAVGVNTARFTPSIMTPIVRMGLGPSAAWHTIRALAVGVNPHRTEQVLLASLPASWPPPYGESSN